MICTKKYWKMEWVRIRSLKIGGYGIQDPIPDLFLKVYYCMIFKIPGHNEPCRNI
jgi:hypothetical protein